MSAEQKAALTRPPGLRHALARLEAPVRAALAAVDFGLFVYRTQPYDGVNGEAFAQSNMIVQPTRLGGALAQVAVGLALGIRPGAERFAADPAIPLRTPERPPGHVSAT